ncbi:MAG: HD domain-containing protein [Paludibacteraceae bacterium]|nr:HD domain-containing protein [Paludibacteraceae bacterium]
MNKRKIINDPVFGFVTLSTDKVYDVLQHPFVQRLGRIRQLGLSYYVYPGAQHSRFSHSIGAMHLMQEGLSMLQQKGVPISSEENEAAQIAILLHDVGHGPFSHVLEHTLVHGITHEEISLMMMEQIDRDLATETEPHPLGMAIDIFRNAYSRHFFHQLLSSQLDVDRMDYLCRDSFFCGVQEGRVASERLLKMLHVVNDHLVVEQKGIYSVEKFLVARRLMYWQVYLHKTSVAAEQLLIKILLRAKELAAQGKELFCSPALHYFLYNHITAEDMTAGSEALRQYALLDDSDVVSAIKAWMDEDDRTLALLCEMFVNRRLFHGTLRKAHLTKAEKDALSERLAKALAIRKEEAHYFYQEHISTSNTYSEKADSIDILYQDGAVKDISEASEILDLKLLTFKPQKLYLFEARTE